MLSRTWRDGGGGGGGGSACEVQFGGKAFFCFEPS